ncbi:MAG: alpha/beta fold hydrolase [Acidimicrobiia bacterium]
MIRRGEGEPLVLLHGITGSETMWRRVVPLLAPDHDVIAFTELGHRGGTPAGSGTRVADVVDDAERHLDDLGLDKAHLAGNSLGGWVALELARRGRALSVCALSPAGCWHAGTREQTRGTSRLEMIATATKLTRPLLPLLARVPAVRKLALRDNAVHGERVSAAELLTLADDLLACTVLGDLLGTDEQLEPLDQLPCPVVIAWAERDRILPETGHGARARALFPGARYRVLPGVGHVPMFDDPGLTASVIVDAARPG